MGNITVYQAQQSAGAAVPVAPTYNAQNDILFGQGLEAAGQGLARLGVAIATRSANNKIKNAQVAARAQMDAFMRAREKDPDYDQYGKKFDEFRVQLQDNLLEEHVGLIGKGRFNAWFSEEAQKYKSNLENAALEQEMLVGRADLKARLQSYRAKDQIDVARQDTLEAFEQGYIEHAEMIEILEGEEKGYREKWLWETAIQLGHEEGMQYLMEGPTAEEIEAGVMGSELFTHHSPEERAGIARRFNTYMGTLEALDQKRAIEARETARYDMLEDFHDPKREDWTEEDVRNYLNPEWVRETYGDDAEMKDAEMLAGMIEEQVSTQAYEAGYGQLSVDYDGGDLTHPDQVNQQAYPGVPIQTLETYKNKLRRDLEETGGSGLTASQAEKLRRDEALRVVSRMNDDPNTDFFQFRQYVANLVDEGIIQGSDYYTWLNRARKEKLTENQRVGLSMIDNLEQVALEKARTERKQFQESQKWGNIREMFYDWVYEKGLDGDELIKNLEGVIYEKTATDFRKALDRLNPFVEAPEAPEAVIGRFRPPYLPPGEERPAPAYDPNATVQERVLASAMGNYEVFYGEAPQTVQGPDPEGYYFMVSRDGIWRKTKDGLRFFVNRAGTDEYVVER